MNFSRLQTRSFEIVFQLFETLVMIFDGPDSLTESVVPQERNEPSNCRMVLMVFEVIGQYLENDLKNN